MPSSSTDDYLYENPPLVEVIAEFRWELISLEVTPGAGVDPHFKQVVPKFAAGIKSLGYGSLERLQPVGFPTELLAHNVMLRFRREKNKWPCVQIGPGIFTVNLTPPYQGWSEFRREVERALNVLREAYPADLVFSFVQLRYVDAFRDSHGYEHSYWRFVADNLNLGITLPRRLLKAVVSEDKIQGSVDLQFPINAPEGAVGGLKVVHGTADEQPGVVAELSVTSLDGQAAAISPVGATLSWFDSAHTALRDWFDALAKPKLKHTFGPKAYLEAGSDAN